MIDEETTLASAALMEDALSASTSDAQANCALLNSGLTKEVIAEVLYFLERKSVISFLRIRSVRKSFELSRNAFHEMVLGRVITQDDDAERRRIDTVSEERYKAWWKAQKEFEGRRREGQRRIARYVGWPR